MSVLWTLSNSWMSVIFVGLQRGEQYSRRLPTIDLYRFNITDMMDFGYRTHLRPEGGGEVDFPVFTYLIRAAGDEQEEKNRTEI